MRLDDCITVIGCHAEGEVGRVITGGVLPPPGATVFAQKQWLEAHDTLRKRLIYEPRGGAFVHVNLIVPAKSEGSDAGFIIMEPTDYPPMSGSNAICVATVLLETGQVPMVEPTTTLRLDTPGGTVEVVASCHDGKCERVAVTNVASYVAVQGGTLEVEGVGTLRVDVAYGGAFFCLVDAKSLGFDIVPSEARALVELGERIKAAAQAQFNVVHPENPDIAGVTFTEFTHPLERDGAGRLIGRNSVVISPGKLDRSPCGTGSSARLAVLHANGEIRPGEQLVSQSVLGTEFHCDIVSTGEVGGIPAVVPRLSGRAWITGVHQYGVHPTDPFPTGYTLSDTWYRELS